MTALLRLFSLLPLPLAHAIGVALGWLFYLVPNRHRRVSRQNLALCFPELSAARQRRLLRRSLIETGKTATESPILWLAGRERTLALVREERGRELIDAARQQGKGVIIIGPHLGSWEMVSLYCSAHYPMTSLYRPLRQGSMEPQVLAGRTRFGARLVPTDARGVRALFKALADNELVGIPPDQDPREAGGVFAPFFNLQANTMTLLSRLALKSGAVPVLCVAERLSWGRGFRMHYQPLPFEGQTLEEHVAAINRAVEALVRRFPEQYQWSYKRFRTRPEGEASLY